MNRSMLWILLVALFVGGTTFTGCKKKGTEPTDALDAARRSLNVGDLERCAKKEFDEARALLDKANKAVDNKKYDEAEELALQAAEQARHALQVARANPDCQPKEPEVKEPETKTYDDGPHDFSRIHFEFDSSTLSPEARRILEGHARALQKDSNLKIRVAGHCSEEGSTEYNLALGNRRAESVRKFLVNYGIDKSRIKTISYGKERPIGEGSINRRAEFDLL